MPNTCHLVPCSLLSFFVSLSLVDLGKIPKADNLAKVLDSGHSRPQDQGPKPQKTCNPTLRLHLLIRKKHQINHREGLGCYCRPRVPGTRMHINSVLWLPQEQRLIQTRSRGQNSVPAVSGLYPSHVSFQSSFKFSSYFFLFGFRRATGAGVVGVAGAVLFQVGA